MILSLDDAKKIDPTIEQEDLDALEQTVRRLTNNSFHVDAVRFTPKELISPNEITIGGLLHGLSSGDTIELHGSGYNDGLYTVDQVTNDGIIIKEDTLMNEPGGRYYITKVKYPADIKAGIKGILTYEKAMRGKIGIKSESIGRMSRSYFAVTDADSVAGYPAALVSFLRKHEKMRWG